MARQPIFDREQNVFGYELLFRNSLTAQTAIMRDGDHATLQIIADGIAIAQPMMDPDKKILINFPASLLLKDVAFALPRERCVIEILETVKPEPAILDACRRLKKAGYVLALDDFVGDDGFEPLLDLADIVKVDILNMSRARIKWVARNLKKRPVRLIAEKVEDRERFMFTRELGFHYFQGFFFSKPETIEGRKTSANQVSKLRLITELGQTDFDAARLSKILQTDASLSHRLFRYVNSVMFGLRAKVQSIKHALVLLGEVQTREWLRVIMLTDLTSSTHNEELLFLSAQRGRFLELIAGSMKRPPLPPDSMFLLGLFSLLDCLMGQPMPQLTEKLPIEDKIKKALCDPRDSLNIWLELLEAYEHAQWEEVEFLTERLGLDAPGQVARLHLQSMEWAQDVLRQGNKG